MTHLSELKKFSLLEPFGRGITVDKKSLTTFPPLTYHKSLHKKDNFYHMPPLKVFWTKKSHQKVFVCSLFSFVEDKIGS